MPSTARKAGERSDHSTDAVTRLSEVTDKMHALLVARADELVGCTENQPGGARIGGAHRHHRSIRTAAVAAWPNSRRQRIAAVPNAHRAFAGGRNRYDLQTGQAALEGRCSSSESFITIDRECHRTFGARPGLMLERVE